MDSAITQRFDVAREVALEAGQILMGWYGRLGSWETKKGEVDLVTVADKASEEHIVARIRERFPGDGILAEEGGGNEGDSGYLWLIDPLDGTTNFVHSFPFFMVSIGVQRADERVAAVCYGPMYRELYCAVKGGGATFNGDPIRMRPIERLDEALVGTGFPYDRADMADAILARMRRMLCRSHGVRRAGAAAYDQCWLAAGLLDGFYHVGLSPWDTAAGSLIVEEAGGMITDYQGEPWTPFSPDMVASWPALHPELLAAVGGR